VRSTRPALFFTRVHLRSIPAIEEKTSFFGTGVEAGADEDDFHTFKRKSTEVDKEQKAVERTQKSKLKDPSQPQKSKKVIKF
jgi:hypothetical protein